MASLISKKQVQHVAKLANLTLSEEELKTFTRQLQDIIGYFEQLSEVDTSGVEATYQTIDESVNVWREDEVEPSLTQKEVLSGAKRTHEGYFVTKSVFHISNKVDRSSRIHANARILKDQYNAVLTEVDPKGNIGHKDLFLTKGIKTTAGSRVLEGYLPQYSSTIVRRLEKAGYKTKYKLNEDAWGHGSSGENSDFGPTKNPWDLTKTPGGSSSGSGVAVAAGMVEVATGTDTCGSIRMPASFTNTTAIKPTYGALSRYGIVAMASSLDCPSLLARSVKDVRKLYRIVASQDLNDATSWKRAKNNEPKIKVKAVGLPKEFFDEGIDGEIKSLVIDAGKQLEKNGFKLKLVSLPHARYGISVYYIIQTTEVASNLARYDGIRYGNDRSFFGSEAKRRIMLGTFASSAGYADKYYEQSARVRSLIIKDFEKAFREVDILLTPVSPTPPFKLGEKTDDPLMMYMSDILVAPVSLAGLPALALPCGFGENLPIGMQLIGPRWSEERLFELGEQYQEMTKWHTKRPTN